MPVHSEEGGVFIDRCLNGTRGKDLWLLKGHAWRADLSSVFRCPQPQDFDSDLHQNWSSVQ